MLLSSTQLAYWHAGSAGVCVLVRLWCLLACVRLCTCSIQGLLAFLASRHFFCLFVCGTMRHPIILLLCQVALAYPGMITSGAGTGLARARMSSLFGSQEHMRTGHAGQSCVLTVAQVGIGTGRPRAYPSSLLPARARSSSAGLDRARPSSFELARDRSSPSEPDRGRPSSPKIARARSSSPELARAPPSSLELPRALLGSPELARN